VQDPEYFNMEKRETYHFHQMENDNISVDKFLESFHSEIQEFLIQLERTLGFYPSPREVNFTYEIDYPNERGYDFEGVAYGKFTYKHIEADNDHYLRISQELSAMKAFYACKVKQANDLVESKKITPVNLIQEDHYKTKRNKALAHLMTLAFNDSTYEAVLREIKKYSPEQLKAENDQRKANANIDLEHHIKALERQIRFLKKTDILIQYLNELYPQFAKKGE